MYIAAGKCILWCIHSCSACACLTQVKNSSEVNKEGIISRTTIHDFTITISIFCSDGIHEEVLIRITQTQNRIFDGTGTYIGWRYRAIICNSYPRTACYALLTLVSSLQVLKSKTNVE